MLKKIRWKRDHRCFKAGEEFEFRSGINLLVGDQGSGKSTLLQALRDSKDGGELLITETDGLLTYAFFDFEKDSPRTKAYFESDKEKFNFQLATLFSSHGETNKAILKELKSQSGILILMDEPDTALSIRSCLLLLNWMKTAVERECQIIAAVHNPILIAGVPEVLSLEHRRWMISQDFIDSHSGENTSTPHRI